MPCLKFIIENANVKELRLLRGKSIECASLIGLAVGSDKFCNDAGQIMNLLLQTQTGEVVLDDDDPQVISLLTIRHFHDINFFNFNPLVILYDYFVG